MQADNAGVVVEGTALKALQLGDACVDKYRAIPPHENELTATAVLPVARNGLSNIATGWLISFLKSLATNKQPKPSNGVALIRNQAGLRAQRKALG